MCDAASDDDDVLRKNTRYDVMCGIKAHWDFAYLPRFPQEHEWENGNEWNGRRIPFLNEQEEQ